MYRSYSRQITFAFRMQVVKPCLLFTRRACIQMQLNKKSHSLLRQTKCNYILCKNLNHYEISPNRDGIINVIPKLLK